MPFTDEIRETEIRSLYGYWLATKRPGRLPLKTDIDPVRIGAKLLPNLFIYRLEPCGRFRALLYGTAIDYLYHKTLTGKYLDEIVRDRTCNSRVGLFERVARERLPVYYSGRVLLPTREQRDISALLLPVSSDGEAADHVLGILTFGPVVKVFAPDLPVPDHDALTNILVADPEELGATAAA